MSKRNPKQPISFRIKPELYDKFKGYCERYDLNQTEVFEKFLTNLETETEPDNIKPVSLLSLEQRVKELEKKIERIGLIDYDNATEYKAISSDDYIDTRTAAKALDYPNSKNLSSYMSKEGFEGIRRGKGKAWSVEDVEKFAQLRNRPLDREVLSNPDLVPDDYE